MSCCWVAAINIYLPSSVLCFRSKTRSSRKSAESVCYLPMDLWAKVFAYLKPNHVAAVELFDLDDTDEEQKQAVSTVVTAQALYHKLKLVCSKFKQVFQEHSELSDELILAEGNRSHMLPSALVWLRQSGSAISNFTAFSGGPTQDMLLAAMSSSAPQLKYVHLSGLTEATLSGLLAFKSLQRCYLVNPDNALSLYHLRDLPCLESLFLQSGIFNRLAIPHCVTSLLIGDSVVDCVQKLCSFTHLQKLMIDGSEVSGMHELGLLACTLLTHLELSECQVSAADPANQFAMDPVASLCIPTQLSLLTNLSHLEVDLASNNTQDFDAGWLYKMASIESLECTVRGAIYLDNRLTQLSKLKDLQVSVTVTESIDDHDKWKICYHAIDWGALHQLNHISFTGPSSFDESILRLTLIDKLKTVLLWNFHPTDDLTAKNLALLSYRLAANRPEVSFLVGD